MLKQLSFKFPYRSNTDGIVKLDQYLRQILLEIDKAYDDDYKWELQKLKRDRDDKNYRTWIYRKKKIYHTLPHPFDHAMQNIIDLVDQAIDEALSEGVTKKNYANVMKLKRKEVIFWLKLMKLQSITKKPVIGCHQTTFGCTILLERVKRIYFILTL